MSCYLQLLRQLARGGEGDPTLSVACENAVLAESEYRLTDSTIHECNFRCQVVTESDC